MRDLSPDPSGLIRRRDVIAAGVVDDWSLAAATRDGDLDRLYRGVYALSMSDSSHAALDERYLSRVRAAVSMGEPGKVVSHHSAAALHRLPTLGRTDALHFSVNRRSGGRRKQRAFVLHATPWEPDEVTVVDGIAVTSMARTAIDVSRSGTFVQAVTVLDGTLRRSVSPGELVAVSDRGRRRVGAPVARRALAIADGRSESVGESVSRALMRGFTDVPVPDLQVDYVIGFDGRIARVDFDWGGVLVGEFDGRTKYGRDGDSADDVWREKVREDALRDLGLVVIRWTWDDLMHPERFHALLLRGLRRAGLI
ncbi:type IV toxin-antitoxin system AbiEi family antitoxin domain-containing protein [Williamsia herbipolensis]|uniref:type IV toxin-antitoxin system AbiEi family antitoxin domain-containing protein n=1 Tax=Williamsia herbipolensis TaxID=1603258 RepID=UPI0005F80687|nr:type IV toxin-antitoxin system AbiEi family antitoxin domain-containing protein [Williamsia herbipolensis]